MTRPEKIPAQAGFEPGIFRSRGGRLSTMPTRRSSEVKRSEATYTYTYIQSRKGHLYGQLGLQVKRSEGTYIHIQTRAGHLYGHLGQLGLEVK